MTERTWRRQVVHVEHRHAREAPHQVRNGLRIARSDRCAAVIHVPCEPSSRPGANIRKKFGWKLSHFTLRTLEIFAELRLAGDVELQFVAELELELFHVLGGHRNQRLRRRLRAEPLTFLDDVVVAEHFRPGDVLVSLGELTPAAGRERDVCDGLAVDMRHASANHRPRSRMLSAAFFEESGESLVLVRRYVDEEEVRRVRRKAAPPVVQQVVADDGEQQQHHDAERKGRELHHALGATPAQVGDAVAPRDSHSAAQAGS